MTQINIREKCLETAAFLKQKTAGFEPEIAVVLGSGLGSFADRIEVAATIPYSQIPHFKQTAVAGHSGNLIFGQVGGRKVVCQQGRYHFYEGHHITEVVFPIRVMAKLGAQTLVVTNAAGGINGDFGVGDIMMIRDHINFQGTNPLIGPNDDTFGPRFPDMTFAYDPDYRQQMREVSKSLDIPIREGVYLAVTGPSYETPAEIHMFRTLGADAVGMSTVPEVIAASHLGMRVLGLSCISNAAAGMSGEKLDHTDVEKVVKVMGRQFENLVTRWIERLPS